MDDLDIDLDELDAVPAQPKPASLANEVSSKPHCATPTHVQDLHAKNESQVGTALTKSSAAAPASGDDNVMVDLDDLDAVATSVANSAPVGDASIHTGAKPARAKAGAGASSKKASASSSASSPAVLSASTPQSSRRPQRSAAAAANVKLKQQSSADAAVDMAIDSQEHTDGAGQPAAVASSAEVAEPKPAPIPLVNLNKAGSNNPKRVMTSPSGKQIGVEIIDDSDDDDGESEVLGSRGAGAGSAGGAGAGASSKSGVGARVPSTSSKATSSGAAAVAAEEGDDDDVDSSGSEGNDGDDGDGADDDSSDDGFTRRRKGSSSKRSSSKGGSKRGKSSKPSAAGKSKGTATKGSASKSTASASSARASAKKSASSATAAAAADDDEIDVEAGSEAEIMAETPTPATASTSKRGRRSSAATAAAASNAAADDDADDDEAEVAVLVSRSKGKTVGGGGRRASTGSAVAAAPASSPSAGASASAAASSSASASKPKGGRQSAPGKILSVSKPDGTVVEVPLGSTLTEILATGAVGSRTSLCLDPQIKAIAQVGLPKTLTPANFADSLLRIYRFEKNMSFVNYRLAYRPKSTVSKCYVNNRSSRAIDIVRAIATALGGLDMADMYVTVGETDLSRIVFWDGAVGDPSAGDEGVPPYCVNPRANADDDDGDEDEDGKLPGKRLTRESLGFKLNITGLSADTLVVHSIAQREKRKQAAAAAAADDEAAADAADVRPSTSAAAPSSDAGAGAGDGDADDSSDGAAGTGAPDHKNSDRTSDGIHLMLCYVQSNDNDDGDGPSPASSSSKVGSSTIIMAMVSDENDKNVEDENLPSLPSLAMSSSSGRGRGSGASASTAFGEPASSPTSSSSTAAASASSASGTVMTTLPCRWNVACMIDADMCSTANANATMEHLRSSSKAGGGKRGRPTALFSPKSSSAPGSSTPASAGPASSPTEALATAPGSQQVFDAGIADNFVGCAVSLPGLSADAEAAVDGAAATTDAAIDQYDADMSTSPDVDGSARLPTGVSTMPEHAPAIQGAYQLTVSATGEQVWLPAAFVLHYCTDFRSQFPLPSEVTAEGESSAVVSAGSAKVVAASPSAGSSVVDEQTPVPATTAAAAASPLDATFTGPCVKLVLGPQFPGSLNKSEFESRYVLIRRDLPQPESTTAADDAETGVGAGAGASSSSSSSPSAAFAAAVPKWHIVPMKSIKITGPAGDQSITISVPVPRFQPGLYTLALREWRDERACVSCRDDRAILECKECGCHICGQTSHAKSGDDMLKCDSYDGQTHALYCDKMYHRTCLSKKSGWKLTHSKTGADLARFDQPALHFLQDKALMAKLGFTAEKLLWLVPAGVRSGEGGGSQVDGGAGAGASSSSTRHSKGAAKSRPLTATECWLFANDASPISEQVQFYCSESTTDCFDGKTGRAGKKAVKYTEDGSDEDDDDTDHGHDSDASDVGDDDTDGDGETPKKRARTKLSSSSSSRKSASTKRASASKKVQLSEKMGSGAATAGVAAKAWRPADETKFRIPQVRDGAMFMNRIDLASVGIHRPLVAGMAGNVNRTNGGTSCVESGSYGGDDEGDKLIYIGYGGGNLKKNADGTAANKRTEKTNNFTRDQPDEKENKAFGLSAEHYASGNAVESQIRVIRGLQLDKFRDRCADLGVEVDESKAPWRQYGAAGVGSSKCGKKRSRAEAESASASTSSSSSSGDDGWRSLFDDGGDARWDSSLSRAVDWGSDYLKVCLLREQHPHIPFTPIGSAGCFRFDGMYHITKREFKTAPWDTDAQSGKSKGLKAFYFNCVRVTKKADPHVLPGSWTEEGRRRERATIAVYEAVIRQRARSLIGGVLDSHAIACGVTVPSADFDKHFLEYVRSTGGVVDDTSGIWYNGDLAAARQYAWDRSNGRDVAIPQLPEDKTIVALIKADARNAAAWEELRASGIARWAEGAAVLMDEQLRVDMQRQFECSIKQEVTNEMVTTPCGHNFDLESLRQWLTHNNSRCPSCRADLSTPIAAGATGAGSNNSAQHAHEWDPKNLRVNAELVAAYNAIMKGKQ